LKLAPRRPSLIRPILIAVAAALLPLGSQAAKPPPFSEEADVKAFVADMHAQYGFDTAHLLHQFAAIRPNATVLRAIRPAAVPEQQRSWQRYRERFVNARRIDGGLRFWQEHGATLVRAEAIYGVPAEIIVAIIGVETEYGRNMGKFGVMEALASLAFHYPPRAAFFRGELEQFLLLARENGVSPLAIKGGDDRIALRNEPADAIGSVARFLQQHGWEAGAPVAAPASLDGDPAALIAAGIKPVSPLRELLRQGVRAAGEAGDGERPAALIDLVTPGEPSEYWVGFGNFYAITRYNRSSFYAMSVFQLAEALRAARTEVQAGR